MSSKLPTPTLLTPDVDYKPDWVSDPLWQELEHWYDLRSGLAIIALDVFHRLKELQETPDRVRSFLLGRNRKPPLRYFLEDFFDWRMRNPVKVTVNYHEYLNSPEWQKRRQVHVTQAEHRCQMCNGDGSLHVHHRTYERLGCERFTDLIALCADCHAKFHDKLPKEN